MKYFLKALRNYATFDGRASRKEFWYFLLVNSLLAFAVLGLGWYLFVFSFFFRIYLFGTFLPFLAVFVRRIQDTGKSGWLV